MNTRCAALNTNIFISIITTSYENYPRDNWRLGFQVLVTRNGMRRCVSNRQEIPVRYLEQARKCRRRIYLTLSV